MPALIPLAAYGLLYAAFWWHGAGLRRAFLLSAVCWGVGAVAFTELLSLPGWLTKTGLAVAWTFAAVGAGATLVAAVKRGGGAPFRVRMHALAGGFGEAEIAALAGAGCLVLIVGSVALVSPPNTTDAMTYHMPRVAYWLQNRSVAPYPTSNTLQLYMPPGAEYFILQFQGLLGTDRMANLVQWFGLLGSMAGVSLIARALGGDRKVQALAAVLCATIPQGILTASGAKNDFVLAFWLAVFAWSVLEMIDAAGGWLRVALCGAALGLAFLTKGTAYVFAPPVFFGCIFIARRDRRACVLRSAAFIIAVAMLINAGPYWRNCRLTGSPLGPTSYFGVFKLTCDRFGPGPLWSNLFRNLALHLGTPSASVNRVLEAAITKTIRTAGEDPNDPATTWRGTEFHVPAVSLHEALAGNPLHLALVGIGFFLAVVSGPRLRGAAIMGAGVALATLLFCAAFRWQPWHTRLHLPLFVLACAPAALGLGARLPAAAPSVLSVVLIVLAEPAVFQNQLRPLTSPASILIRPRADLYFTDAPHYRESFLAATEAVRRQGCRVVGLDFAGEHFEYPLIALLKAGGSNTWVLPPGSLPSGNAQVCAVICSGCAQAPAKWGQYAWLPRSTVFRDTAVFSRGKPATDCRLRFSEGWYAREESGPNWWRWAGQKAEMRVSVPQGDSAEIRGELGSLATPNTVSVSLNSQTIAEFRVDSGTVKFSFQVPAGSSVIEFAAHAPPATAPGDLRRLGFSVLNVTFTSRSSHSPCEVF